MTTNPGKNKYLLDTNILIGFSLWKPMSLQLNNFFWLQFSELLGRGDWILLDVVVNEVNNGYDLELKKWCKQQKTNNYIQKISSDNRIRGIEINNIYPMIDQYSQKSTVDTYLLAYAEENNLGIFSREAYRRNSNDLYKIPDVCDILNIKRLRKPKAFLKYIGFN